MNARTAWARLAVWAGGVSLVVAAASFVGTGNSGMLSHAWANVGLARFGLQRPSLDDCEEVSVAYFVIELPATANQGSTHFHTDRQGGVVPLHFPEKQVVADYTTADGEPRLVLLDEREPRLTVVDLAGTAAGKPVPLPRFGPEGPVLRVEPMRWNRAGDAGLLCFGLYWAGIALPGDGQFIPLPAPTLGGVLRSYPLHDADGVFVGYLGRRSAYGYNGWIHYDRRGEVVGLIGGLDTFEWLAIGRDPRTGASTLKRLFTPPGKEETTIQLKEQTVLGEVIRDVELPYSFLQSAPVRRSRVAPENDFFEFRRKGELLGYLHPGWRGFSVLDASFRSLGTVYFFFDPPVASSEELALHGDDDGNLYLQRWHDADAGVRRVTVLRLRWTQAPAARGTSHDR